jgi:ribosomal protein S12 methylthiotransferase
MKKKLQTVTLGCSKNKVDTEHILSQVEDLYEIIPEGEDIPVDVMLLNTCGFIGDAKEESIQAVLEAVEKKNRGDVQKVIVFGCLSQRYASDLPELIPEVDAWFGARDFDPVVRALGAEPDPGRRNDR